MFIHLARGVRKKKEMTKDPYKIVDTKPSWSSRLGSGVVALGSVATAVVITVPGLPGYEFLSQSATTLDGVSVPSELQGNDSENSAGNAFSTLATSSQQFGTSPSGAASLNNGTTSARSQSAIAGAPGSAAQAETTLSLPGVNSGNTSSPTPYSAGQSGATNPTGGNASAGNTSSPTPGGSSSEYEEEYEEDEEEEEEEEEEDEEESEED